MPATASIAGVGFVTVSDCGWDMHANENSPRNMTDAMLQRLRDAGHDVTYLTMRQWDGEFDDLEGIGDYIARDNPAAAERWVIPEGLRYAS